LGLRDLFSLWSQVRIMWLLIWWQREAYMVVNFRVRGISQGTCKLAQTPTLKKKKKRVRVNWTTPCVLPFSMVVRYVFFNCCKSQSNRLVNGTKSLPLDVIKRSTFYFRLPEDLYYWRKKNKIIYFLSLTINAQFFNLYEFFLIFL